MHPRPSTPSNASSHALSTPRRHKTCKSSSKASKNVCQCFSDQYPDPESVKSGLKTELDLSFEPDDWQVHLIHRIRQEYDGICLAATGLGKSLLFEGTAKLAGKGKMVFVICPLKALECDQMLHAQAKGLEAIAINEDTDKTPELWEQLFTTAQIVYLSPDDTPYKI